MAKNGSYRTDDLALATVIAMAGYSYKLKKLTERKAIWIFQVPASLEEDLEMLLADYEEFAAEVEPRAFVLKWGEMRRELFAMIPAPPKQRPHPSVAPAQA